MILTRQSRTPAFLSALCIALLVFFGSGAIGARDSDAVESERLELFDELLEQLENECSAITLAVDLRPSWTNAEIRAGHQAIYDRTARFAKRARALLAQAELELDPGVPPPPGGGAVPPSGPPLSYTPHPDIPFAPLSASETAGYELGAFASGDDYRSGLETILGYESKTLVDPSAISNRAVVWDNRAPTWNPKIKGPLWGWRAYNVSGTIENLYQVRAGDWTNGKEGHALYLNVIGDVELRNVWAIECGAQALQITHRPAETAIAPAKWTNPSATVRIVDSGAINCGAINQGDAVRASWPLAFYAPGQSIEVVRFKVRTNVPTFATSSGPRNAHGGVFIGPASARRVNATGPDTYAFAGDRVRWTGKYEDSGETFGDGYFLTPTALIEDLDVEVWNSDREEVHLRNVGSAKLIRPRIVDHGGKAELVIVDDCGRVEVVEPIERLHVTIKAAGAPFGANVGGHVVEAGERK